MLKSPLEQFATISRHQTITYQLAIEPRPVSASAMACLASQPYRIFSPGMPKQAKMPQIFVTRLTLLHCSLRCHLPVVPTNHPKPDGDWGDEKSILARLRPVIPGRILDWVMEIRVGI